ncbi:hypothetical protein C9374_002388 [Naegleria lovaniensis]|uniref:Uncharacterized protein n=1 Tax=Naegleria lovaniensis TaxID=51637 RepID=A0AA88GVT3_NAELO|nr:uncharacterized protein C9374_002388 [Naegleria lovaniensis]KAG2386644.1 hypothetical protein C9374_002388 [Naegleria lovaniensis]
MFGRRKSLSSQTASVVVGGGGSNNTLSTSSANHNDHHNNTHSPESISPSTSPTPNSQEPREQGLRIRTQSVASITGLVNHDLDNNTNSASLNAVPTLSTSVRRGVLQITSSSTTTPSTPSASSSSLENSNTSLKERKKSLSSLKSILTPRKYSSSDLHHGSSNLSAPSSNTMSSTSNDNLSASENESSQLSTSPGRSLGKLIINSMKSHHHSREGSLSSSLGASNPSTPSSKTPLHVLFGSKYASNGTNTTNHLSVDSSVDIVDIDDDSDTSSSEDSIDDHDLKELKDSIRGYEKEIQSLSPNQLMPSSGRCTSPLGGSEAPKATINGVTNPSNANSVSGNSTTRTRAASEYLKKKKKNEEGSSSTMDMMSFLQDYEEEKKKEESNSTTTTTTTRKQAPPQQTTSAGRSRFNTLTEKLKKAYYEHKKRDEDEESDGGESDDGDSTAGSSVAMFGGKNINILAQLVEEYKGMGSEKIIEAERTRREQERVFSPLVMLRQLEKEKRLNPKYKVVNVYFEKVAFM